MSNKNIENIDELIDELEELNQDVEEASLSSGAGPYNTPYAFSGKKKKSKKQYTQSTGWNEGKDLSLFKKIMLGEATYKDYKKDETISNKKKVNLAIKEVSKMMFEIEKIINQNIKLKTETGINSDKYWKTTHSRLNKISERMLKVSNKIKNLRQ